MWRTALRAVLVGGTLALASGCGGGKSTSGSANGPIAVLGRAPLGTPGIYRVNSDGCCLQQLTEAPARARDALPAWAPDGKQLAFIRASAKGEVLHIEVVDATGGDVRQVPGVSAAGYGLSWSPDGGRILFAGKGGLWTVSPSEPSWASK